MAQPKIAIIFYTTYGTNHAVALEAQAAAEAAGADVRLRRVPETAPKEVVESQDAWKAQLEKMSDITEVSHDDMTWADGYFFITPTRYGNPASQMRAFIDTLGPLWMEGKLADKTVTMATSANTVHGGQETTLLSQFITFSHWGCIIVPPGYTDQSIFDAGGNPYGFSKSAGELTDTEKKALKHQTTRFVEKTAKLAS
ncbi:NAD(P)H dehydrogenase (quinone) [Roseivivax jejudonensis]|uniref:NAD(P)H dehydrogenase (Quinone) n=1 Tax=Roseivivax jejudonensis TaxID=1529041 RepID=A0A1X7A0R4_9RHOB|nr:NAD(P)H-dependent oxidoreductase [Roseivivax jejudonensis]SLN67324.1 NAD(P)H dehydrogenase (quinone) [Roseivivax jejudonensis]